ncbi:MAG: SulP family inorganic anion transporter [Spirochaetaceae bacterium]|nr:SulP family inorganic anion transporter [Spirochaetaceae bacterium]
MPKAGVVLASELRADVLSPKTVPALSAGFTSGLGLLVAQIAFGSLIFSGALAPWSSQGVGLVLFGNFAACLIFALAGGYRGTIAGLSPALVIAMATVGASMAAEGEARFVTAAVALMISAAATGVGFFLLGRFRLANLVRFIPYPVTAGFVAGIGASVCLGGLSLMGAEADVRSLPALLEPSVLQRWGPGAAYGIALYLAIKRWGNPLILPVSVVLAVGAYHLVLAATGVSGDEARAAGLLLTSTAQGGLWPVLGPADLARVAWADLAAQIPHMLTLILIAFICVVMNVAGIELAANQELDWDREFPGDRRCQRDRRPGRRHGGDHRGAGVPAQQAARSVHSPDRRRRRRSHRRRPVARRRDSGDRPGAPWSAGS